jgi:iron-sulfur cluster assembly protein
MDFDDVKTDQDEVVELQNGFKVVVDKKSVLYLFGTELQYSSGLNGKGFQWVNPNASRTCGCGESFSL